MRRRRRRCLWSERSLRRLGRLPALRRRHGVQRLRTRRLPCCSVRRRGHLRSRLHRRGGRQQLRRQWSERVFGCRYLLRRCVPGQRHRRGDAVYRHRCERLPGRPVYGQRQLRSGIRRRVGRNVVRREWNERVLRRGHLRRVRRLPRQRRRGGNAVYGHQCGRLPGCPVHRIGNLRPGIRQRIERDDLQRRFVLQWCRHLRCVRRLCQPRGRPVRRSRCGCELRRVLQRDYGHVRRARPRWQLMYGEWRWRVLRGRHVPGW